MTDDINKNRSSLPLVVCGAFLLVLVVVCLHVFDRHPWPAIGAACLTFIFSVYYLVSDGKRDIHLSYFLTSQLLLAYFSRLDRGKGPHGDSPLSASADFRLSNKNLRTGLADHIDDVLWLEIVESICMVSWLVAIALSLIFTRDKLFVGWVRKTVFVLLSLSYVFLHGIMAGLNGVSHRFYMSAYSFVALLLEVLLDVDAHPYVCLFAGFTFFSAGISKLRNSSLSWLNGQALCRYIRKDYTGIFQLFCSVMAPMSVMFEVGAPSLMLFGPVGRVVFVLLALSFHLSIAVLMFPRYTPQACSYALLFRTNPKKPKRPLLLAAMVILLLLTTILRVEVWPLTAVSMYSIDIPNNFGSTLDEAHRVAKIIDSTSCLSGISFPNKFLDVRIEGTDKCREGVWALRLAKPKLIKQVLIQGLASALVCMENGGIACSSSNEWLDMYTRAVWDECEMDSIDFSLVLNDRRNHYPRVPVYSWESDESPAEAQEQKRYEL